MNYRFKRYFSVKRMAYIALFVALGVIANTLTFYVPMLGVNTNAVSFTYLVCALAGIFMGPVAGGLVGGIGDILGWLINPSGGAFNVFITMGSVLLGAIPGLVFKIPKLRPLFKIILSYVIVFGACTCGLNNFGIWFYYSRASKTYAVYLATRLPAQSVVIAINIVLTYLMYYPLERFVFKGNFNAAFLARKVAPSEPEEKGTKSISPAE